MLRLSRKEKQKGASFLCGDSDTSPVSITNWGLRRFQGCLTYCEIQAINTPSHVPHRVSLKTRSSHSLKFMSPRHPLTVSVQALSLTGTVFYLITC